jgi:hypothetical protein
VRLWATAVSAIASRSSGSPRQSAYLSENDVNDASGSACAGAARPRPRRLVGQNSVIAWWQPIRSRAVSVIVWSIRSIDSAPLIATDAAASFWSCAARRRSDSACR